MRSPHLAAGLSLLLMLGGCVPKLQGAVREAQIDLPSDYGQQEGTPQAAPLPDWRAHFQDPQLVALIETALAHNQELALIDQELRIADAEVNARRGEYLPRLGFFAGAETEKVGRYTSQGANDANTEIAPGVEFPEPLPDFGVGLSASWEIDAWGRLRNSRRAAQERYLQTTEGRNFAVTELVAEIAGAWYALQALHAQMAVLDQNVEILENSLRIVRLQRESAQVTQLAVQRFEAELLEAKSERFQVRQEITEAENEINLLCARYPQPLPVSALSLEDLGAPTVLAGQPGQLLERRPDVRAAERGLEAAKLDVKAAKALFYPTLSLDAELGYEAFSLARMGATPESILYNLALGVAAPLLNRQEIKAQYVAASAQQMQATVEYERTVLQAYLEVSNQVSAISNQDASYHLQAERVAVLERSIESATRLFGSARADYLEVLTTRQELLFAQMELIETRQEQLTARAELYRALGGGWDQTPREEAP